MVFIWAKKMIKAWEEEILSYGDNDYLKSAAGK